MRAGNAALAAIFVVGCASSNKSGAADAGADEGVAEAGGSEGGTDASGADAGGATTITVSGLVVDLRTQTAVAGVNVCLYLPQQTPMTCTLTSPSGAFQLAGVPASTQVMISYQLAGYVPSLVERTTATTPVSDAHAIIKASDETAIAQTTNLPLDLTKAQIAVTVSDGTNLPVAGATATASPSAGDGPYYIDTTGLPNTTLMATTGEGLVTWLNSPGGDVEITVVHGTAPCPGAATSWPGSAPGSVKVHLVPGFLTGLVVTCP